LLWSNFVIKALTLAARSPCMQGAQSKSAWRSVRGFRLVERPDRLVTETTRARSLTIEE
jgi:hypothetical protein